MASKTVGKRRSGGKTTKPAGDRASNGQPDDLSTARRRLFVERYLIHGNQRQAAEEAGYSKGRAEITAVDLMKDPTVRAEIEQRTQKLLDKFEITQERVLEETASLAFSDITEILGHDEERGVPIIKPVTEWSPRARKSISKVKVKRVDPRYDHEDKLIEQGYDIIEFGLWDKTSNLDRLFKHLALTPADDPLDGLSDKDRLARIEEILMRGKMRKAGK